MSIPFIFRPVTLTSTAGLASTLVDGGLVDPVPVSLARALGAERVIAVNLARRLSKVVLKPGRDDRFVELEVLPSGELIVADEGARLWRVAPTGERELVFDNLPEGSRLKRLDLTPVKDWWRR